MKNAAQVIEQIMCSIPTPPTNTVEWWIATRAEIAGIVFPLLAARDKEIADLKDRLAELRELAGRGV